jgi:hypothetical protein
MPGAVGVEVVPVEAGTANQIDGVAPTTGLPADQAAQGENLGHRGLRVGWGTEAALPITSATDRPDGESNREDSSARRAFPP